MSLNDLLRRDRRAHDKLVRGTIVSSPKRIKLKSSQTEFTWVVDVDVNSNRPLLNVPIKIGPARSRSYAQLGRPVFVTRGTEGRWQVVGPADRVLAPITVTLWDEEADTTSAGTPIGATYERIPFSFFRGPTPGTPGTSLWADGVTPFGGSRMIDGDGDPI